MPSVLANPFPDPAGITASAAVVPTVPWPTSLTRSIAADCRNKLNALCYCFTGQARAISRALYIPYLIFPAGGFYAVFDKPHKVTRASAGAGKGVYNKTDFIHGSYLRLKEIKDCGIEGCSTIRRGFEMKNLLISYPAYSREFLQPQNCTDLSQKENRQNRERFLRNSFCVFLCFLWP